jgi:hypothetical protein
VTIRVTICLRTKRTGWRGNFAPKQRVFAEPGNSEIAGVN